MQTAVLGSFSTHLAVASTTESTLAFKNVCGLVKVTIDAENVSKIVFEGNSDEIVSGGINVTVSDAPAWTEAEGLGAKSVTLAPVSGNLAKGSYYFAVLPQTFKAGFKVTAYKGAEATVVRNVSTEYTLERAGIVGGRAFGIEGAGTEASPYILKTAQDMVDMRSLAADGGETWFKMANDIDMKGITNYVPVNYGDKKGEGDNSTITYDRKIHFDGGNFTLSNFSCNFSTYPSLFGVLYGSCKDLKITNATIEATSAAGILAGYVGTTDKPATVTNVSVKGAVSSNKDRLGGISGVAQDATFTDCTADVEVVSSSSDAAGFVGKVQGTCTFTGCEVKAVIESSCKEKNRVGCFIGWNGSVKTTIDDCHVLEGSSITDKGGMTAKAVASYGGFIGFGDAKNSVLEVKNSSAKSTINAGAYASNVSGFIATLSYTSVVTITNCSAEADITAKQNYVGGIVGQANGTTLNLTVTGCHFNGTLTGASGVGGIVGAVESTAALNVSKSYMTGSITATGHNAGGVVGLAASTVNAENCWSNVVVTMASSQFGAGIVGGVTGSLSVNNCYSLGEINVSRGAGGIVGQVKTKSPSVVGCIAWNSIKTNRSATQYSPGAIVANLQIAGKLAKCYRKADMSFSDVAMKLVDHEDIENGRPALPVYEGTTADSNQYAYHGKAAAANATVSSVAKSIGWDENVWDLTGDLPVLKASDSGSN